MARLPEVEYPTITVFANLPGASAETMATAVATPLERMFGRIAGITQHLFDGRVHPHFADGRYSRPYQSSEYRWCRYQLKAPGGA
jgi:hypothetical protein